MRCRRAWQTEAAPESEPERRPRGGGCSADSTQGRGSPAAGAVSEGPRQRWRDFPPLLNLPSGPRGQVPQPWELLQPCGSATLSACGRQVLPSRAPLLGRDRGSRGIYGWCDSPPSPRCLR